MISMKAATAITTMIRTPISWPSVILDPKKVGDFVTDQATDNAAYEKD